jgi:hypothetical protein
MNHEASLNALPVLRPQILSARAGLTATTEPNGTDAPAHAAAAVARVDTPALAATHNRTDVPISEDASVRADASTPADAAIRAEVAARDDAPTRAVVPLATPDSGAGAEALDKTNLSPVTEAPAHVFKFSASVNSARESSVYDKGPQMVEESTRKIQLHGASQEQSSARLKASTGQERAEQNILMGGSGMVQLANVSHRVEITVNGVLPNQGYYEATLKNPARGHDGQVLPNQVSWVAGKIVNGSFQIDQARINDGKPFSTIGHLSLRPQHSKQV